MIIHNRLTVRDIEALVKKEKKKKVIRQQEIPVGLTKSLSEAKTWLDESIGFGRPVKILNDKLILSFASEEEVRAFLDRLTPQKGE
jgi:hypothetical protein